MRALAALLLLAACAPLCAQEEAPLDGEPIDFGALEERRLQGLEQATGFIVDRTVTHFGGEFMRLFSQAWRAMPTGRAVR